MGQGTCIMAVGLSIWVLLLCTTFSVHVVKGEVGANCTGAANCSSPNETCGSNNVCACNSGYYQIDKECYKKPSYNGGCSQSIPCKDGLTCNISDGGGGQCKCPNETTDYWDDTSCVAKHSYNETCSSSIPCGNDLTCNNAGGGGGGQCKCPDETSHYWSGSSCVEKSGYDGNCSADIQCRYNLICPSGKCYCSDEDTKYWDNNTNTCQPKKELGESCTNVNQCLQTNTVCDTTCKCDWSNGYYDSNGIGSTGGTCKNKDELRVNINVAIQSTTAASVTWNQPTGVELSAILRYVVKWTLTNGTTVTTETYNVTNSITSYTISTLTPGRTYSFTVGTVVAEGLVTSVAVNQTTAPSQPGNISSESSLYFNSLRIQWNKGVGYVKYYDVTNTAGLSPNPVQTSTENVSLSGATPGRRYTITVAAVAEDGTTRSASRDLTFRVNPEKPGTPINVACKNSKITDKQVTITWQSPSNPNGEIKYYVVNVSGPDLALVDNTTENLNEYTLYGSFVKAGTSYIFMVATVNDASDNQSPFSASISCQTKDAMSEEPRNLDVDNVQSRQLRIKWTKPNNTYGELKGYTIQIGNDSRCLRDIVLYFNESFNSSNQNCEKQTESKQITSDSSFSYPVTNLSPYTNYSIDVTAINTLSGHTAQIYASTTEEVPKETPTNIAVTKGTTSAVIHWSIPGDRPGITTFHFYVMAASPAENKNHSVTGFYVRFLNITGLQENWLYHITMSASTSFGEGPVSSVVQLKTLPAPPGKVQSFDISRPDGSDFTKVKVQWTPPSILEQNSNITGYVLTHNITGTDTIIHLTFQIEEKILNVTAEKRYLFKIYAVGNQNLTGAASEKTYDAVAGAPPTAAPGLIAPAGEATDTSTFVINMDIAFFTDSSYGTIKDFGLLVCKDSCPSSDGRKNYKASDFVDTNKVPSWHQAKDDGLKFYRATGQKFIDLIQGRGSTRRRRKRSLTIQNYKIGEDGSCDGQTSYCNGELESGSSYIVIAFACTAAGCTESGPFGPFATKTNIIPIVVGVLIPVLLIIGIVIGVGVYKRRNSGSPKATNGSIPKKKVGNPRQKLNDIDLPDVHTSTIKTSRPVALKDFADYVASLHKDANLKFAQQYEDLKDASPKLSTAIANLDENKVKNRYVNILPFDESRVKLSPLDSENDDVSGYINANYMPGYTSEREYIACQGPLPGTIDDFWRMVWEKNVSICVMLTLVKEENKVKCETYWPTSMDECKQFGDIVVELQSESVVNTYVVRIFKMAVGDKARTLKQFHFLTWKDFSANVTDDVIISFINNVRSHIQPPDMEGPMVVHCSAGVGRTGTYITIDYLIQFIDNHDFDAEVDIFKFIYEMRKRRMCMVQTEQQFIFIHDCAKVLIQRKYEKLEENVYENQAYNMDNLYENVSVNKDMRTEF